MNRFRLYYWINSLATTAIATSTAIAIANPVSAQPSGNLVGQCRRINSDYVGIFIRPASTTGTRIGVVSTGAIVRLANNGNGNGWIEIDFPKKGYLEARYLSNRVTCPPNMDRQSSPNSLETSWKLVQWGRTDALKTPLDGTEITAQFVNGQITGFGSCNNYTSSYTTDGNTLTISAIAATRKACPPPILDQETAYFALLQAAKTYQIDAQGRLQIAYETEQESGIMIFERQAIRALW